MGETGTRRKFAPGFRRCGAAGQGDRKADSAGGRELGSMTGRWPLGDTDREGAKPVTGGQARREGAKLAGPCNLPENAGWHAGATMAQRKVDLGFR